MNTVSSPYPAPKTKPTTSLAVEALVDALQKRTMWTVMREALKKEQLPVGQGWKDLLANVTESTSQGSKLRTFVQAYFSDAIVAGERYVQIYQLGKEQITEITDFLTFATPSISDFSDKYPLPLDQKALANAPSEPTLCEIRLHENGDATMVFCSARNHDDRESYAYDQLPKHIRDTYLQIDKLVTYRKIYYQAYDVITIRKNLERIEVCVDQPEKLNAAGLDSVPLQVLSASALHIPSIRGIGAAPPENLFPAIAGMYYESTEGIVKALSFRTLTGSIKKERMTASTDDLRDEKFHHAGMNALGQKISPYELTLDLTFNAPDGSSTLKLAALIRELSSANPTLYGCYVSTTSALSLERTLNRLITYLN